MLNESFQKKLEAMPPDKQVTVLINFTVVRKVKDFSPSDFESQTEYRHALIQHAKEQIAQAFAPIQQELERAGLEITHAPQVLCTALAKGTPDAIRKAAQVRGVEEIYEDVEFELILCGRGVSSS